MLKLFIFLTIFSVFIKFFNAQPPRGHEIMRTLKQADNSQNINNFQHNLEFHQNINNIATPCGHQNHHHHDHHHQPYQGSYNFNNNFQHQANLNPNFSAINQFPLNNKNTDEMDEEDVDIDLRTILNAPSNCQKKDFKGRCL